MNNYIKLIQPLLNSAALALFLFVIPVAMASDSERHQRINNIDVYLGVIPSQLALEHPEMHKKNSPSRHDYHVLVALYDINTGLRIKNAEVKASVSDSALTFEEKTLDPMHIYDALSYGNFFSMSVPGKYKIQIEIQRAGMSQAEKASFVYQRPND